MKSVTEFANFTLTQALKTKSALSTEGKSPEEIQESLGQTYKLEGDKLKHFNAALDVAAANPENLKRVMVLSLAEGENAPPKAVKVEEHYYVPEFHTVHKPAAPKDEKSGRGGKGGRGGGGGRGGNKGGGRGDNKGAGRGDEKRAQGPASRPIPNAAPTAPKE